MRIALVVAEGAATEAARYLAALPRDAYVWLYTERSERRAMLAAAREHRTSFSECRAASDTVRMADIVSVFGRCPFGPDDIARLESQGIAVEVARPKNTRRKHVARKEA